MKKLKNLLVPAIVKSISLIKSIKEKLLRLYARAQKFLQKRGIRPSKGFILSLVFLFAVSIGVFILCVFQFGWFNRQNEQNSQNQGGIVEQHWNTSSSWSPQTSQSAVLNNQNPTPPNIYFSAKNHGGSNSLIGLSFYEEPKISMDAYNLDGKVDLTLYASRPEDVLNYYLYSGKDEWNRRTDSQRQINLKDLQALATWQENWSESKIDVLLPIKDPGVYFLKAQSGKSEGETFIIVSKTGTTYRKDGEKYLLWSQNLENGNGEPGVQLFFYNLDKTSTQLEKINTDEQGLATVTDSKNYDMILAEKNGDFEIIPASGFNPNYGYNPGPTEYKLFVYTDRPLYKPGDTVYFRGIVRLDNDASYELPAQGTEIKVELTGYYGTDPMLIGSFKTDNQGVFYGSYKLGEELRTSGYSFKITINQEIQSGLGGFTLAEYRKPEYILTVDADRFEYINGDTVKAVISGSYFFGQPLGGKEVKYKVQASNFYEYQFADLSYYKDQVTYRSFYDKSISEGTLKLDENGRASLDIPLKIPEAEQSKIYTIWVEILDENQNLCDAGKNLLVHKGEFNLFTKRQVYSIPLGGNLGLEIKTLGPDQKPYPDVNVSAEIKHYWWDNQNNEYKKKEEELDKKTAVTDENGTALFTFTPDSCGSIEFIITAKDSRENKISSSNYFWVYDPAKMNYFRNDSFSGSAITLTSDKDLYSIGDTAKITASLPGKTAQLLLTTEKGKIYEHRILNSDSLIVNFDVIITDEYLPNIYANLSSFIQNDYQTASLSLPVKSEHKKITISLTPDKNQYSPGEQAQFTIKTKDSNGQPIAADLSLALVDKAIYELNNQFNYDIFENFYKPRSLTTKRGHSLEGIWSTGGGGAGGGEPSRENFADTAYWNPQIQTDNNGMAVVKIKLPDNLTTWVAAAFASTGDTKVGQEKTEIVTSKEIILRPVLPNFLTGGDEMTLQTVVQNFQGKDDDFSVSLASEELEIKSAATQNIRINNDSNKNVYWNVKVKNGKSKAAILFSTKAKSTSKEDKISLSLPVNAYGFETYVVSRGTNNGKVDLKPGGQVDISRSKITVSLAPSLSSIVSPALEKLADYPYGCIEQTTSRFVPAVIVKNNLDLLKIEKPELLNNLDLMLEKGFQRLAALQKNENKGISWSWWQSGYSDIFVTSYVVESLRMLQEAGVKVPDGMYEKAQEYLRDKQDYGTNGKSAIYGNYVLSRIDPTLASIGNYKAQDLDDDELAVYVLLLKNMGKEAEAKSMAQELYNRSKSENSDLLVFKGGKKETFGTVVKSTAWAIRAMLAVGFEPDKLSATVRELAGKDLGNHNQSTYDTVQTLIALVEYAKVSQELSPNYTYQILLDGKLIQEAKINSNNFRSKISPIEIGYNQINQGGSNLEFRKNGEGYLYYTTVVSEYKTYKTKVKDDQKIAITKTITGEGGKTSGFRTGDLVKVELEVENKTGSQIYYLVINDPLPAGMAAIDPRLENQTSNYSGFYYERDVRNDSAKFFPYSLTSGIKYKFSYSARVISAGNYQISPTSAYPMYEQEISGRSDNSSATFIQ